VSESTTKRRGRGSIAKSVDRVMSSRPVGWYFMNIAHRADKVVVPLTRGRFSMAGFGITAVGVLTTTGAKSGQERRNPLVYLTDGERVVLIASKGGSPKHPAWYHNLRANPDVKFHAKRGNLDYRAHEAEGEERDRLWARINDEVYAGYNKYQGRAGERRIPVVVLEPAG
jgi:deazaflavin-dependent oxidoreductase (nitroreductase family)